MSTKAVLILLALIFESFITADRHRCQVIQHPNHSHPHEFGFHREFLSPHWRHLTRHRRQPVKRKTDWLPQKGMNNSTADTQDSVFSTKNATVVEAHIGSTAILECKVKKASQFGMMTWARLQDEYRPYSVLTVGDSNYVKDKRYMVSKPRMHTEDSDLNWFLRILRVSTKDEGSYECQATTYPPQAIVLRLIVVEAVSEIVGSREKIIRSGSILRLQCLIKKATEKPQYIFWFHDSRMINYDSQRGVRVSNDMYRSVLTLNGVSAPDSGNYSCSPDNARSSSVIVQVIKNGHDPASIQSQEKLTSLAAIQNKTGSLLLPNIQLLIIINIATRKNT